MRFKVKKALYPCGTNNDSWQLMNLIVDDDIPSTEIIFPLEGTKWTRAFTLVHS